MSETLLKQKTRKKSLSDLLDRKNRQAKLLELFKKHIGRESQVTQRDIFMYVFGDPSEYTTLQIYWMWDQLKKDMNWLRRTTNCFIVCRPTDEGWRYYLPKDIEDIKPYLKLLDNTKKRCDYMMKRAVKAVRKKFHEDLDN